MRAEHIEQFLHALGAENIKRSNGNYICSCPLAHWTHAKGTDRKPSFSIKINDSGASLYNCFACGFHGTLLNLLCCISVASGKTPDEAYAIYERYEYDDGEEPITTHKEYDQPLAELGVVLPYNSEDTDMLIRLKKSISTPPVPKKVLQLFPCISKKDTKILEWLIDERKITIPTIIAFRLRKFERDGKLGVIFPIISRQNVHVVLDMYVRLIDGKQNFRLSAEVIRRFHPELGDIDDYKATHLCVGNHLYDPSKTLTLVEAPLDAMRLYSLNCKNVLATCGALSKQQADALYARTLYLGFDADDAGKKFTRQAFNLLKDKIPVIYALDWSKASLSRKVKDPNDLDTVGEALHVYHEKTQLQGIWPSNYGF